MSDIADLVTRDLTQLPPAAAISPDALMAVQEPTAGAPVVSLSLRDLVGRLIQTVEATPTDADLQVLLDYPANSIALVYADPDAEKNGWYRKTGASGAGAWSQFEILASAALPTVTELVGQVFDYRTEAMTARDIAVAAAALTGEVVDLDLPGPWIAADKIGTAGGGNVQEAVARSPMIFAASGLGFTASMTSAAFNALQTAVITKWGGGTIMFDLDIAVDVSGGQIIKPAGIDWTAKASGATLYPSAGGALFVVAQGEIRVFGALRIDGRSLITTTVFRCDANSRVVNTQGLWVACEGRPVYTGNKTADEAALAAIGSSTAAFLNCNAVETRDKVSGLMQGIRTYGVGNGFLFARDTQNLTLAHCGCDFYANRGFAGRGTFTAKMAVSNITLFMPRLGQGLASTGPRYPITFFRDGAYCPSDIRVLYPILELGGRPHRASDRPSTNGTSDSINFHGVKGGEIIGFRTMGTGEAGVTIAQGCADIVVDGGFVESAETVCISIGPSGEVNERITVINNRVRMTSIDLADEHGSQPFIAVSNVNGFTYGGNTAIQPRTANVAGVTRANPAEITIVGGHDFMVGDPVVVAGIVGTTQANATWRVAAMTPTSITLADLEGALVDGTAWTAYTSGGTIAPRNDPTAMYNFYDSTGNEAGGGGPCQGVRCIDMGTLEARIPSVLVTGITNANPAVATVTGLNSFVAGNLILLSGSSVAAWNRPFRIKSKTATTITLQDADTGADFDGTALAAFTGAAVISIMAGQGTLPMYDGMAMYQSRGHRVKFDTVSSTGAPNETVPTLASFSKSSTGVYVYNFKMPVRNAEAVASNATSARTATAEKTGPKQVTVRTANSTTGAALDSAFTLTVSD